MSKGYEALCPEELEGRDRLGRWGGMGVAKKANFRKEILVWFTVILGAALEGQNVRLSSYNGQNHPTWGCIMS